MFICPLPVACLIKVAAEDKHRFQYLKKYLGFELELKVLIM